MRNFKILTVLAVLILAAVFFLSGRKENPEPVKVPAERSGTAIIMTGAAARIPQEAALLEELYNRGLLENVVFISGVSSGSLNATVLNGILSGRMTWDEYRKILFGLNNSDVFIQEGKKLPVNTDPLRNFITGVVEGRLGYRTIGDLPVTTAISFTHIDEPSLKKTVYRMCSTPINRESDTTLSLVDILMASTSFPIAFPPVRIRNVKTIPDVGYIDGGVGDDHVPFEALLEFEKHRGKGVEKVYIISRKSDSIPEISEELQSLGINDKGRFDKLGVSLDNILQKGMYKRLKAYAEEAPDHVAITSVWIPDFKADFPMFSFSNLEVQYKMTTGWAKTHQPVPLAEYLLPYLLKK
jgi:predicted acylesterase/phospholipase RssA